MQKFVLALEYIDHCVYDNTISEKNKSFGGNFSKIY